MWAFALLRERLTVENHEQGLLGSDAPALFDRQVEQAVIGFQRRHGLDEDGVVGRDTVAALNISAVQRVRQIALNLERWRWLPGQLGDKYILVNTADFTLALYENQIATLEMPVIVGKPDRQTPIISKKMQYLVLNPTWTIPATILKRDILPKLENDPDYFKSKGMCVFAGWGANAEQLDEAQVDWSRVSPRHTPYKVQQLPGVQNALGQVKFMFPNQHSVYIHDTPSRSLFKQRMRALSAGCVRVAYSMALASALLGHDGKWSNTDLQARLKEGATKNISLAQAVPVHLAYLTAWVGDSGDV